MNYVVWAAYDVMPNVFGYDEKMEQIAEELAIQYNAESGGSGSGFGQRDIDWSIDNLEHAFQFRDALRANGFKAIVTDEECETIIEQKQ